MNKLSDQNSTQNRCYRFSLGVIHLTNDLPNKRSSWVITDQVIRSATSIGANIIEAKSASSRKDFRNFFEIALKSANETEYWLELLGGAELAEKEKIEKLQKELKEISNIIGKSVITLKSK